MIFIWTVLIVILHILAICFFILRFYAQKVEKRQDIFKEALWQRRHRVPILIEETGNRKQETGKEIIEIRRKLQSEAYSLEEEVKLEKKLTELIAHLFQELEVLDERKTDAPTLSLQKEFAECLSQIRIAQNDYHFVLQKFLKLTYPFKISKNKPLELI